MKGITVRVTPGLKGNHIHIFARIAGMVDVFDAWYLTEFTEKGTFPTMLLK